MKLTMDSTHGFRRGDRVKSSGGTFKVTRVEGNGMSIRPWRWYDEPWARITALWLAIAAAVGLLIWLFLLTFTLCGCGFRDTSETTAPAASTATAVDTCSPVSVPPCYPDIRPPNPPK